MRNSIIFENDKFALTLDSRARATSLTLKGEGRELISGEGIPFFRINELRPYHNEIKLAYPTAAMSFDSNSLEKDKDELIVGFELLAFRARVKVSIAPSYMTFTLVDFITDEDSFGLGVIPMRPPVESFELVRLSLSPEGKLARWLNVSYDGSSAVGVLSSSPYGRVVADENAGVRTLRGEVMRSERLFGEPISLIASQKDCLLDAIDSFERDFGLPLGVESRRQKYINRSYYWCSDVTPENVDEHIKYAKLGGFELMSIYYTSILREEGEFISTGEYDSFRPEYPNGLSDVSKMLERIKESGIKPGLHVLPTHVGLHSKYLTPRADRRLNLSSRYTLSRDLSSIDTEIYVDECPSYAPTYEKTRVIRIMGELVKYESFTTERPYRFIGCERGYNGTSAENYQCGTTLGILDISEFCANSAYVDLKTELIDEIADGIARLYDAGFEFVYFDGAEGVNPPFDVNVALAQKKVYDKLTVKPLFCEAAAKSHFSWHMISGGNAFDIFAPSVFKEMMVLHPFAEAERMQDDLTRVNFGWWSLCEGHTPDTIEFATALAAAWDCPGSLRGDIPSFKALPRAEDIFAVLRIWENARRDGFITDAVKAELRRTDVEHTLYMNEKGEYELAECEKVKNEVLDELQVSAYIIYRETGALASIWANLSDCTLEIELEDASYGKGLECLMRLQSDENGRVSLPVGEKKLISTALSADELKRALMGARAK